MATKKETPQWTSEDEKIGNDFLKKLNEYEAGNTMSEKFRLHKNKVAHQMGYQYYNSLPTGVKSFISHLGGKKRKKKVSQEVIKPQSPSERWLEDLKSNPSMQHGLHPEDDADIISALEKSTD